MSLDLVKDSSCLVYTPRLSDTWYGSGREIALVRNLMWCPVCFDPVGDVDIIAFRSKKHAICYPDKVFSNI